MKINPNRPLTLDPSPHRMGRGERVSNRRLAINMALRTELGGQTARRRSGFTMVEIAISLAVIGFALVAIIGILPSGMQVQKENRQDTIINQDAGVFLDLIRNGAHGADDMTNYVYAITNFWTVFSANGKPLSHHDAYTYTNSESDGTAMSLPFPINSGNRIVGLLSVPRYINLSSGKNISFRSNYVVAYVRSMSGPASDKSPQINPDIQSLAFSYRLVPEIAPYAYYDPNWTNYGAFSANTNSPEYQARLNYMMVATNLQQNLHDLRLTFRWPLFPNGNVGQQRQTFRTVVGGHLTVTNENTFPAAPPYSIYFFQPRNYVKAP